MSRSAPKFFAAIDYYSLRKTERGKIDWKYSPLIVECKKCFSKFYMTKLMYGPSDLSHYNRRTCPECGENNCCDIEFEEPNYVELELILRMMK